MHPLYTAARIKLVRMHDVLQSKHAAGSNHAMAVIW